jgi:hypothetical protein
MNVKTNPPNDNLLVVAATIAQQSKDFELAEQLLLKAVDISNSIHGEHSVHSALVVLRLIELYENIGDSSKCSSSWITIQKVFRNNHVLAVFPSEA